MSSAYRIAPVFLIRMAGAPFEAVAGFETRETFSIARRLIALERARNDAAAAVERIFLSGERPFSDEAYRALKTSLRTNHPPSAVAGTQPAAFMRYAEAATEVDAARKTLQSVLEGELLKARKALLDSSAHYLSRYVIFASPMVRFVLAKAIGGEIRTRDRDARKAEQTLLMYLQRIATKNDTFSEFGPSTWGRVTRQEELLQTNPVPGVQARESYLERWTAHAIAAAVNEDLDASGLQGLHLRVPALDPYASETLAADVERWPDSEPRRKWLPPLQKLSGLPLKFREAKEPDERGQVLDQARILLENMGARRGKGDRFLYSAANPIGEECLRESEFRVSEAAMRGVTRDAAPWIDLWRDSYAFVASRVTAGLRQILEKAAPGSAVMPLPLFLQTCAAARLPLEGPGLVALAVIAFQEVKAAMAERLRPHSGKEIYDLTVEDCHVLREHFQYPPFNEYTYPSADIQIAAASIAAAARGEGEWMISELHPPIALLHHGVYWGCPDPAALNEAFAQTVFGRPSFHFGFFAADFTSHTAVRIFDALPKLSFFVAPQRGNSRWQTVPPSDAEVFVDPDTGDVGVRHSTTREYLGSFARAWLIPLGFHPFQFTAPPDTPRLRCGKVIVQRRAWTVSLDELELGEHSGVSGDLVIAIERLRGARALPRYVYIRPTEKALRRSGAEGRDKDTKPVFVDLESYLFIEIFHRWLVKAGELEVTEMLPAPDQLPWQEADGHHTFEMRTLIVPGS